MTDANPQTEYDSPWKQILQLYFEDNTAVFLSSSISGNRLDTTIYCFVKVGATVIGYGGDSLSIYYYAIAPEHQVVSLWVNQNITNKLIVHLIQLSSRSNTEKQIYQRSTKK
jgi:hypothetical protein